MKPKTNKEIQEFRHKWVDIYKMSIGCEGHKLGLPGACDGSWNDHPSALTFDHLPGETKSEHVKNGYSKRPSAGGMFKLYSKNHTIEELIEEIKKCRVLCTRCHTILTHQNNARYKNKPEEEIDLKELEKKLRSFESGKLS
jgi:hypothetical protein